MSRIESFNRRTALILLNYTGITVYRENVRGTH